MHLLARWCRPAARLQARGVASEATVRFFDAVTHEAQMLEKVFEGTAPEEATGRMAKIGVYYELALQYAKERENERDLLELCDFPELKEESEADLVRTRETIADLVEKFDNLIELVDEADELDVILETEGGAGGAEGSLFACELFEVYRAFSREMGWTFKVLTDTTSDDYIAAEGTNPVCLQSM